MLQLVVTSYDINSFLIKWHKFFLFHFFIFLLHYYINVLSSPQLQLQAESLFFFQFSVSLSVLCRCFVILSQKPYFTRFPLLGNVEICCLSHLKPCSSLITIGFILSFSFFLFSLILFIDFVFSLPTENSAERPQVFLTEKNQFN